MIEAPSEGDTSPMVPSLGSPESAPFNVLSAMCLCGIVCVSIVSCSHHHPKRQPCRTHFVLMEFLEEGLAVSPPAVGKRALGGGAKVKGECKLGFCFEPKKTGAAYCPNHLACIRGMRRYAEGMDKKHKTDKFSKEYEQRTVTEAGLACMVYFGSASCRRFVMFHRFPVVAIHRLT